LQRTNPLLDIDKEVIQPILKQQQQQQDQSASKQDQQKVDVSNYNTAQDMLDQLGANIIKEELAKLGLKCGGTPLDRAKRLFLLKDTPLEKLPPKHFVKKKKNNTTAGGGGGGDTANVISNITNHDSVEKLEATVMALLTQLRPTLDATIRRIQRRQTQTLNEREREVEEELYGNQDDLFMQQQDTEKNNNDDDDDDDDDQPIYNPKGVPLGWDGKPIPYWLFKLHGLNHYYPCEICGNESYRGRRNFEKHFSEAKHAFGMKCLGIPNTKHFHGVVKMADAKQLWEKLRGTLTFAETAVEEYEDSHGNVLSREKYEDLARQGLL